MSSKNNTNNFNVEIQNINNTLLVSSQTIANNLNKDHNKVCEKIIEVLEISQNYAASFEAIKNTYKDSMNRTQTEYLLTKDGFILLLMNYTGYNEFKRAYIKRFNEMEQQLLKFSQNTSQNTSQNPPSNSFPNLNPKNVINKQSIEAGEIQYFYLSNAEYLALPYFRWRKFKQRYLVCVDDYLLLTNFNTTNDANALRKFCQLTGCELEGFGKIDLFFCEFIYMIDFLNTKNNTLYNILRENLEVNFKKNIVDLINANLDIDLAVNSNLNNNLNNNLYTEQLLLAYQEERQETEELTIELGDKIRETEQLKDKVSEQEEIIKLFAEEINSRNTKLKIKANIVLNVNAVVFKTDYNHLEVYNYMYKQLFLMHPNVDWREEFFTADNKLNYLMEKNINYLKELENLVLDLNLNQEYKQAVSR